MEVKKIKTVNNDVTISEIEVDFDVCKFEESKKRPPKPLSFELYIELAEEWGSKLPQTCFEQSFEDSLVLKMDYEDDYKFLHDALEKLSRKQKRRIFLRFWNDLTISQIAKIKKCSISAVNAAISLGLQNLTKILKEFKSK